MKHNKLTRDHLNFIFCEKFRLSQERADRLLDLFLFQMVLQISHHSSLKIKNFGTFAVRNKKERTGRNPKTGEEAKILARKSISFRASKALRTAVNSQKSKAYLKKIPLLKKNTLEKKRYTLVS